MAGIGFFAPLPLAMMLPFMAGQSMMMGDAFGKSYQYGKRKISAMSNEEFNKLSAQDLAKEIVADFNTIIPSMKTAMAASTEFQGQIIQEMGNIIKSLPAEITKFFGGEGTGTSNTIEAVIIGLLTKALNLPSFPGASAETGTSPQPYTPPTETQGPPPQTQAEWIIANTGGGVPPPNFIGPTTTPRPPNPPPNTLFKDENGNWVTYDNRGPLKLPPPTVPILNVKRKMGQSQQWEYKKLTESIRRAQDSIPGKIAAQVGTSMPDAIIKRDKQLLANLLARYNL